jgi:putative Holliday junction resolvase
MRIMGLDIGDKYIGIAVSDPLSMFAQPFKVITRTGDDDITRKEIEEIIIAFNVSRIVFGLPKNMNGSIGPQTDKVLVFIDRLKQAVVSTKENAVEFVPWDERLSSRAAENAMLEAGLSRNKRKQIVDKIAASIILQGYLDSRYTQSGQTHLK